MLVKMFSDQRHRRDWDWISSAEVMDDETGPEAGFPLSHETFVQLNNFCEGETVSCVLSDVKMAKIKIASFGTSGCSNRVTLIRQQRTYFKKPSLSH